MRFFDYDPFTGIRQDFEYDAGTDTFVIRELQDIQPHIEANKAKFNEFSSGRDKWGDMSLVASVPPIIANQLMMEGKIHDQKWLRAWLDNPDNAVFRTRPGRLT